MPEEILEDGAERDAGEQQPHRRGGSAADGGEGVDEHHRHDDAGEGEPDVGGDAGQAEQPDRDHDEQPRARVDPEDLRVGEGVAGDRLDDGAGDAERGADEDRQDGPRHPQVPHDRLVGGAGVVRERVPDRGRGQVLGAHDDAQQAAHREDPDGHGEPQPAPGVRGGQARWPLRRSRLGHDGAGHRSARHQGRRAARRGEQRRGGLRRWLRWGGPAHA
ncbi:hypothetical protein GCM10027610_068820 [Dactylosporangium cerinum]